jgi:hypothetical protein
VAEKEGERSGKNVVEGEFNVSRSSERFTRCTVMTLCVSLHGQIALVAAVEVVHFCFPGSFVEAEKERKDPQLPIPESSGWWEQKEGAAG